jgi:hypothetical protein
MLTGRVTRLLPGPLREMGRLAEVLQPALSLAMLTIASPARVSPWLRRAARLMGGLGWYG